MNQTYTLEQAMERLGIKSVSAFRRFARKYPLVFRNVNPGVHKALQPLYDKTAVDKFAQTRDELIKSEG